jgi:hypothetical protein
MVGDGTCRFAVPAEKPVHLDSDGFLLAPSDPAWEYADAVPPTPVTELPAEGASFALLAAGGAGKTVTFTELSRGEGDARRIDTAALTIEGLERELNDACFDKSSIYLDSLDQAASVEPRLLPWLEQYLTAPARRGMRWRLACRAAAWDAALDRVLSRSLPVFTVWKLAPLDRGAAATAVERAIESPEFDTSAFMAALVDAKLGRLSGCVGQLVAVARYWDAQGELPRGAADAMIFEIEHLLRETDERKQPLLPMDRSMRLAKRLGAFTLFAGNQALTAGPVGNRATLPVGELPSDAEPDQPARTIEPADYRAVLDTALFDSGPPGSVVFRHQRYLEYLAAAYLVERGVRAGQVPVLLGVHANGLLPAARIGVASWLAALAPELVVRLFAENATMFASAAAVIELPSDEARAALVQGLLEAATREDAEPDWRLDRTGLIHAGLADQLATCLSFEPVNSVQLWWIARLAAAGDCGAVAPALARAALAPKWVDFARRAAVAAVAASGDDDVLLSLRELLALPAGDDPDPDNEVRAAVIDALYPRLISTTELTPALRPHEAILFGSYHQTLGKLPARIPEQDLAEFLGWLAEHTSRMNHGDVDQFESLHVGVIDRAWHHVDDDAVGDELARLLVALVRSGRWQRILSRIRPLPWAEGEPEDRRALAVAAADQGEDTWYAVLRLGLLTTDDASWLLDTLTSLPDKAAHALENCLIQLLHSPPPDVADRVLELAPDHPAYQITAHLRGQVAVDDASMQPQRRMAAEEYAYRQQRAAQLAQVRDELGATLARLDAEPDSWWRVPWLLAEEDIQEGTAPDLTLRPGWAELSPEELKLVLAGGLLYLETHEPSAAKWWAAPGQLELPDWSGVYLLSTLQLHIPAVLNKLSHDVWVRWLPSIIATPVYGGNEAIVPRQRLLDAVPGELRPRLLEVAGEHLNALAGGNSSLTPHAVYTYLVAEFSSAITARLFASHGETGLAGELLTLLVENGPAEAALDTCRRLVEEASPLAPRARRHLARLDPDSVIDTLVVAASSPEDLAEAVQALDVTLLSPTRLAVAARLLLDSHPYTEDPPLASGFARVTARSQARDLRRHVLERMSLDGYSEELAALSHGRPEADQRMLAHYRRIARARQAELSLGTTTPRTLLSLLSRGDARLVRDDGDLQHVLVQELDALQHYFAGAWREIWNDDRPQAEDDVSDWLERRLGERLDGVIIDREIQVRRDKPGIGTRIDLTARAGGDQARVLVEAKRVDNDELMTAMHDQLIDRYLIPRTLRHGIYLIYWITPAQRPPGWSRTKAADKATLQRELDDQARRATEAGFRIVPYILDISRP